MKKAKDEIVKADDTYVAPEATASEVVPAETNGVMKVGLTFKERPVKLLRPDGQGGEIEEDCILRQLSGKQRDQYLQMIRTRSKTTPDGKGLIVQNLEGLASTLIQWSLFRVEKTDTGRKLHQYKIVDIEAWPDEAQDELYAASCELSKIGDRKGKKAKDEDDDQGNE